MGSTKKAVLRLLLKVWPLARLLGLVLKILSLTYVQSLLEKLALALQNIWKTPTRRSVTTGDFAVGHLLWFDRVKACAKVRAPPSLAEASSYSVMVHRLRRDGFCLLI